MAFMPISKLQQAKLPLTGEELLEVVQDGLSRRIRLADILNAVGGGGSGDPGEQGEDGKSAFELWQQENPDSTLTLAEWLTTYVQGSDGKSAYDIAVETGQFTGPEEDFVVFLKGDKGDPGVDGADGQPGADGENGEDGSPGKSAFQIWQEYHPDETISEEEWLETYVKGTKGDKGDKGDPGQDGSGGGTGGFGDKLFQFDINSFLNSDYDLPEGVTAVKVYSDTSLQVTHNKGAYPFNYSVMVMDDDFEVFSMMVFDNRSKLQIVDENTVIFPALTGVDKMRLTLVFP